MFERHIIKQLHLWGGLQEWAWQLLASVNMHRCLRGTLSDFSWGIDYKRGLLLFCFSYSLVILIVMFKFDLAGLLLDS